MQIFLDLLKKKNFIIPFFLSLFCVLFFQNCGQYGFKALDDVWNGSSMDLSSTQQSSILNFGFKSSTRSPAIQSISKFEMLYAARDLLQDQTLGFELIANIPMDNKVGGFESAGSQNYDENFIQTRIQFAEIIAQRMVRSRPLVQCSLPKSLQVPWTGCIETVVKNIAELAFRRPLVSSEIDNLKSTYESQSAATLTTLNLDPKSTPIGSIDGVSSLLVAQGWSIDPLWSSRTVEIHFYIDGPSSTGTFLGNTFANSPRADINQYFATEGYKGDYAFKFKIPNSYADGKVHEVYAYAIGGVNPFLGKQSFQIGSIDPNADQNPNLLTPPQLSTVTEEALRNTIISILLSPSFQLRKLSFTAEMSGEARQQYQIASHLSWFLGSSIPDKTTLQLAAEKKLKIPAVYLAEVKRLLQKNSERVALNIFGQWLGFRDYSIRPGLTGLEKSMIAESTLVFKEILDQNLRSEAILKPGFTFVDETLAAHYGLGQVPQNKFTKVVQNQRGGILTQGSILMLSAPNNSTKPIVRGKWVQWNLLCRSIPAPSPELFAMIAAAQSAADPNWSVSERLAQHRNSGQVCLSCHQYMDPLGLALENYGPTGLWRTAYPDGKPVISSGKLDEQPFSDVNQLTELIRNRNDFKSCVVTKLLSAAISRPLAMEDLALIQKLAAENLGLSHIIQAIAVSPNFLSYIQESP